MRQLVIAEKPSVARDLARVLGVRASGRHSFSSDARVVSWCIGHLVELEEPAAYDPRWKSWRLGDLPMIPQTFRLSPVGSTREQLNEVSNLLRARDFDEVVNACDAGREGELIFRYVYELAGSRLPVRRLWISSLTDESIRRGFASLRAGAELDPLGDAARCRSEADWLVGLNATRAVTLAHRRVGEGHAGAGSHAGSGSAKAGTVYSIGRVQTPTLAILVKRERAIRDFVPADYWEVRGTFNATNAGPSVGVPVGPPFVATWGVLSAAQKEPTSRLGQKALAEALLARLRTAASSSEVRGASGGHATVERVRQKTTREPPPQLFDLTSLQRTANRRYGMSATRTLEVAQSLYERHKVLTYPRTDARHLTGDLYEELPRLFAGLAPIATYAPFVQPLIDSPPARSKRVFDDGKVQDHHAIIPTGKTAALGGSRGPQAVGPALDRDEANIFDLVVRRFLGVFHPDAEFALTDVVIRVGAPGGDASPVQADTILTHLPAPPDRFFVRGRVRLVAGWQEVAGIGGGSEPGARRPTVRGSQNSASDSGGSPDTPAADAPGELPPLREGEALRGAFDAVAKATKPPPHHTEASLLSAMESAGQEIDDEALRAAMKDTGLGTPATRASTIETLIKRGFVSREAKQLRATATGMMLIETLPVPSLASPELTGAWEARLARIARGQDARASFMRDIATYVTEMVEAVRGHGRGPAQPQLTTAPSRFGPRPATAGSEADTPPSPKHSTSPKITKSVKPAAGASASAPRVPKTKTKTKTTTTTTAATAIITTAESLDLPCPVCGAGRVVTGKRGWGCSRWRDGCDFVIWFESAGRHLTVVELQSLVRSGRTPLRVHLQAGTRVSGRLLLDLAASKGTGAVRFSASAPRRADGTRRPTRPDRP